MNNICPICSLILENIEQTQQQIATYRQLSQAAIELFDHFLLVNDNDSYNTLLWEEIRLHLELTTDTLQLYYEELQLYINLHAQHLANHGN